MKVESNVGSLFYTTPVLQGKTSTGKAKFWQGFVLRNGDDFYTGSRYCQEVNKVVMKPRSDWDKLCAKGVLSKIQFSTPILVVAKNIGRSNVTTPKNQAIAEIDAQCKLKIDKGYVIVGKEDVDRLVLPMLAHKYVDKHHLVRFPCISQPKLDGTRLLTDGKKAWSRGGKLYIPEVVQHILEDLAVTAPRKVGGITSEENFILDGELIMPEGTALQDTMKAIKKYRPGVSDQLLFRVYDVVLEDASYAERYAIISDLVARSGDHVILVPSIVVNSEEELNEAHIENVRQGWEGTMVRLLDEGYKVGHRSSSLLKIKDFQDSEFEVVYVREGKGRFEGAAVFGCVTEDGERFEACPVGTMEERRYLYEHPDEVLGMWTIRYQVLTARGVPQFPRAICRRDPGI